MFYQENFENFKEKTNFTRHDPCIWIVYPAGAAGDLLASIVNFHYCRSGFDYFGIKPNGQVVVRPTDFKTVGTKYNDGDNFLLSNQAIKDINQSLSNKNLNATLLSQAIFTAHTWQDQKVNSILDFFPNCKIIRILPGTQEEQHVINWLSDYKNLGIVNDTNFVNDHEVTLTSVSNSKLLDITFGNLLNQTHFESTYSRIIAHLGLDYKLIRYDLIEFWLSNQHLKIKPTLLKIQNTL